MSRRQHKLWQLANLHAKLRANRWKEIPNDADLEALMHDEDVIIANEAKLLHDKRLALVIGKASPNL